MAVDVFAVGKWDRTGSTLQEVTLWISSWGQQEVVQIFEELSGKRFQVQQRPEEALQSQKSGTSDPLQESFAALMLYYSRGDVIDMKLTLQNFPIALISVKAYAKRILAIGSKGATIQAT